MNTLKDTFTTESGIKTLVNMCIEGKLFEPINTTAELNVHNYMVAKFKALGLCNENLKEILEFATRLPEPKTEKEGEKVFEAYFGKTDGVYTELDI